MSSPLKILVFARYPEPGKVKTRLAKDIGKERAAAVYRKMAQTVLSTLQPLRKLEVEVRVHGDPPERLADIQAWLKGGDLYLPQEGSDLGARMNDAFAQAFKDGGEQVLAIGTDCIELSTHVLRRAFDALAKSAVAIGPARDGGYYLLGLHKPAPELFRGIKWGTETVFHETVSRLKKLKLTWTELEPLRDIDRLEDVPTGYWKA